MNVCRRACVSARVSVCRRASVRVLTFIVWLAVDYGHRVGRYEFRVHDQTVHEVRGHQGVEVAAVPGYDAHSLQAGAAGGSFSGRGV